MCVLFTQASATIIRNEVWDSALSVLARLIQYQRLFVFFILANIITFNLILLHYQQLSIFKRQSLLVVLCDNTTFPDSVRRLQPELDHERDHDQRLLFDPTGCSSGRGTSLCKSSPKEELTVESVPLPQILPTVDHRRPFEKYRLRLDTVNTCAGKVDIIVCVHTHPARYDWRKLIRRTWANQTFWPNSTIKTVFFTGFVSNNASLQAALEWESHKYGDMVQGEFEDSYRNLSYKALTVLHWVKERCSNATYFFKVDDDVIVNVFSLQQVIVDFSSGSGLKKKNEIVCYTFHNITVKRTGKWAVTYDELPKNESYPAFCAGMGYITRVSTALALRDVFDKQNPFFFFWVDDIFVTGYLAAAINATHTSINTRILWSMGKIKSRLLGHKWRDYLIGHARNVSLVESVWTELVRRSRDAVAVSKTAAPAEAKKPAAAKKSNKKGPSITTIRPTTTRPAITARPSATSSKSTAMRVNSTNSKTILKLTKVPNKKS